MFSFIKLLKNIIERIKSKKWLFFSIISFISFSGIIITMYILTTLTFNVSDNVYKNVTKTYSDNLEFLLKTKEDNFKLLGSTIVSDNNLKNFIINKNNVEINNLIKSYNEGFAKENKKITISFIHIDEQINRYRAAINTSIGTKVSLFGFEVLEDGVYITLVKPLIIDEKILGVIEVKENIIALKQLMLSYNGKFIALALDKKMLQLMPVLLQKERFNNIKGLKIDQANYDGSFVGNIINKTDIEYDIFLEKNYMADKQYFTTKIKISDITGNDIGILYMGELITGEKAYLKAINDIISIVTKVALGLIVSIIMFMF